MTDARLAYYNENDAYAAQWLRNLIAAGHIAPGDVDERSVADVRPTDLVGYRQHHFFAGLGGWSYALRLAGWPDDFPVWTGSAPCQPFSQAGKGDGFDDERHLWPAWFHLIREYGPSVVFREQVESAIAHGWLDLVQDDMEAAGYVFGAAGLPAASAGAPHIRQRIWFVAYANRNRLESQPGRELHDAEHHAQSCRGMGAADGEQRARTATRPEPAGIGLPAIASPWSNAEWIPCRDGKARPIEPGTFPLAHGVPNRVGRLRAYGNAIVPQTAAEFIKAYREVCLT